MLKLANDPRFVGWDDPRFMTLCALRRRGCRPTGIKIFADTIGVSDRDSTVRADVFDECMREDLDPVAQRRMVVLDPLKIEVTTYGKDSSEEVELLGPTFDPSLGNRTVTFSNEVWIERDDFMEGGDPSEFFRFSKVGSEVKLKFCYVLKLEEIVKDASGKVVTLKCSHNPDSKTDVKGSDGKKVKGVIHWVDAKNCNDALVRLISAPLILPMPDNTDKDFTEFVNPKSRVDMDAKCECNLNMKSLTHGDRFQFERKGYFAPDYDAFPHKYYSKDVKHYKFMGKMVFNRVVAQVESAAKMNAEGTNTKSRKAEQEAQRVEKERLSKIPPQEFFKSSPGPGFDEKTGKALYSQFDAEGVPTHDADGAEVTKSAGKKLKKEWEKQKKLYESANKK